MAKEKHVGIYESSMEITNQVTDKILKKLEYLKSYERFVLRWLSPNEIVYKVINDLLALQKDGNYQDILKKYEKLKNTDSDIETKIWDIKSELVGLLGEDIDVMKLPLKWSLSPRLRACIACWLYGERTSKVDDEYNLLTIWDLVRFCLENKNWENYIKTSNWLWEGAVKKVKELLAQYKINIQELSSKC